MEYVIETNKLCKNYMKNKVLKDLDVHIPKGSIYGLVGKNGAGKTTIMKMISGMASPSSGSFSYVGFNGGTDEAFSRIGVLIEAPALQPNLTAYDNMKMKCLAYGIGDKQYINDKLELVGLGKVGKKKAGKFSLGMKQRLGIAMALVGNPDCIILDEPMNGLDPEGIIAIRNLILKLNKEKGITFIISSHILDELSRVASVYGFIRNGNLVKEIDQQQLHEQGNVSTSISTDNNSLLITILDKKNLKYSIEDNDTVYVYAELSAEEIMPELNGNNIKLKSISTNTESLESIYLNIMKGENA